MKHSICFMWDALGAVTVVLKLGIQYRIVYCHGKSVGNDHVLSENIYRKVLYSPSYYRFTPRLSRPYSPASNCAENIEVQPQPSGVLARERDKYCGICGFSRSANHYDVRTLRDEACDVNKPSCASERKVILVLKGLAVRLCCIFRTWSCFCFPCLDSHKMWLILLLAGCCTGSLRYVDTCLHDNNW